MMSDPRQTARNLLRRNSVTLELLWLRYWAEGGDATAFEFDAYLHEALNPPAHELRIIEWAMEEIGDH